MATQAQQHCSQKLRALSKSGYFSDLIPTPEPGTDEQDRWAIFESLASQIEDNPDVVEKIAHLINGFALAATSPSSSGDALDHMLDLIKVASPKARLWAARRQKELEAEKDSIRASSRRQEEYERKAQWWVNDLADRVAHTNPVTGVGLDADHIEFVAMSLGFLLQATSLTVRRTLKLERVVESKASATGKVIGFSSGVALGALLCAGSLVCPLPVVAGVVAPWALGGAATGTLAGASAAIGSVVGVVKSGIQLDKTIKWEPVKVNMYKVDVTVRCIIGYLCFLYNIQIKAKAQNTGDFIEHLRTLSGQLSQPVSVWTDKDFQCTFFEEAASDLEKNTLELSKSMRKAGLSINPLECG